MKRVIWNRWPGRPLTVALAAVLGICLLLTACAGSDPETGTGESGSEAVAEVTPGPPTGGDYHSTVIRARYRTLDRLNEAQSIREEQVREEASF